MNLRIPHNPPRPPFRACLPTGSPPPFVASGFSLMELLTVIGVFAILAALALPAWDAVTGMQLKAASDSLGDAISVARQIASSKGRETRIAFTRETENGNRIRAFQLVEVVRGPGGAVSTNRISRNARLPDSVVLNEDESPLLADWGGWQGLRFRPGGRPEGLFPTNNYLVLHPKTFAGQQPANYIVLQVNPVSGHVQKYQP